ncbi:MAG: EF-Tu/IF-2/RF-3 family GTPase, partial [Anaerolineales bacterium]
MDWPAIDVMKYDREVTIKRTSNHPGALRHSYSYLGSPPHVDVSGRIARVYGQKFADAIHSRKVDDLEWLDLVEIEIHELLSGTILKDIPVVRVSAKERTGLDDLLSTLGEVLEDQPPRPDLGRPRLSVDRVFLMQGFGSVVTGTLLDGSLHIGDEISLLPSGIKGRIRGLQNHSQEVQEIGPGNRVAVNISGVDQGAIKRGDVVIFPGSYQSTKRLDVRFQHLANLEKPIKHDQEVKLFLGADETTARIRLLGQDLLQPGAEGWMQ